MTRQTKSILFWKRRMSSKSYISWDLLCESHICDKYVVFCGKYVCNTSCSERTLIMITIQTFLQIFDFVDIKVVESAKKERLISTDGTSSSDGNIIIYLLVTIFLLSTSMFTNKINFDWMKNYRCKSIFVVKKTRLNSVVTIFS